MIFFSLKTVLSFMCCDKKKENEKEKRKNCCNDLRLLHMNFVTFENEG